MISRTNERFRAAFAKLSPEVRQQARRAYRLFRADPGHPSLRFKSIHPTQPIYSVRIGLRVRALGVRDDDVIVWFWIGSHAEYDHLIAQRRP